MKTMKRKDVTNPLPSAAKPTTGMAKNAHGQTTTTARTEPQPGASKSSSHLHPAQTSSTTKGNKK